MSKWWNNEMGTAGTSLYNDPWLAANSTLTPTSLIPGDQQPNLGTPPTAASLGMTQSDFQKKVTVNPDGTWSVQSGEQQRPKGFMDMIGNIVSSGVHDAASGISGAISATDKFLNSVPVVGNVYSAQKWLAKNLVVQPLDTMASGAYWLYSNAVSQPITTAILQMGKVGQGNAGALFSGDEWGEAYHQAEHISPGQAYMNVMGTQGIGSGEAGLAGLFAVPTMGLSLTADLAAHTNDPKYLNKSYLYDNNYWQQQNGWKYTVGTGFLDASASIALDPTMGAGKALKGVRVATRAVKVAEGATEGMRFIAKPQTAEQLVDSDKFQSFADWGLGKSPEEIRYALERGRGSRGSAFTSRDMSAQLADVLSNAQSVDDWKLATRFAMGDAGAFAELSQKSQSFALAYGKALDNRVNITNADNIYQKSFNSLVDNNFTAKPIKPSTEFISPSTGQATTAEGKVIPRVPGKMEITPPSGRSMEDRVKIDDQGKLFVQSPYVTAGPRTDEEVAQASKPFQQLAFEGEGLTKFMPQPIGAEGGRTYYGSAISKEGGPVGPVGSYEVKPIDPASLPTWDYKGNEIPGLQQWKLGIQSQLDANQVQLQDLVSKNQWLSKIMGTGLSDPAATNPLFGSMQEARFAGFGRDVTKQAERRMVQYMGVQADAGFQSRLLQNGIYGATVRFIGKAGDRLPTGIINHNDGDAAQRLTDYLKASPINNDDAAQMVKDYSRIADKSDAVKYVEDVVEPKLFETFGQKYNMDLDTVQEMYSRYRGVANQEAGNLRNPKQMFSAPIGGTEGAPGTRIDRISNGEGIVTSPILNTQLQYSSMMPNLQKFDRFLANNADNINMFRRAGMNVSDSLSSFMDSFNTVFKLGNLLRVAYVARNVGEETVSQAAKFGAMAIMSNAGKGGAGVMRGASPLGALFSKGGEAYRAVQVNKSLPMVQEMQSNLADHISGLQDEIARRTPAPVAFGRRAEIEDPEGLKYLQDRLDNAKAYQDEFNQYESELLQHGVRNSRALGEGTFMYKGQVVPEAFNESYSAAIPRDQITSEQSYKTVFGRIESFGKEDMIRSGNWVSLTPTDTNHMNSWERAVNYQILQDEVGKRVVQDPTGNEALKFLKSPDGAMYRKNLGLMGGEDSADHIRRVSAMVDQYIPDSMRQQAAQNGKVAIDDFKSVPIDERPVVHGEELKHAMQGDRNTFSWFDNLNEKWFQGLPKMASDRLSWQPTYVQAHRAAMQDLIDLHMATQEKLGAPSDFIDMDTMNKLMQKADGTARQTMKEILYQPNRTNTSHALRYISPFFNSYTDTMSRWGGLVVDNPDLIGKFAKIYNAPVAANMVTDMNGNKIDENGNDPSGNFVGMDQRVFNLQINPLTKNLPPTIKNMKVNVGSLNVVTPGDPWWSPGFGPVVAIPADTVMRNYPESSKFLNWVNPYGTQAESTVGDIGRSIAPAWVEDFYNAYDKSGQKYQDAVMASYRSQMIDYHQNGGAVPDWKKAESDASNLFFLNALADGVLPGKTRQSDKYQFYVDALKSLRANDASTANDQFMAKYGKDFRQYADALMFTVGATKSGSGIPSTIEGLAASQQYGDLIKAHPELGGFIIGDPGQSGKFNSWALLNQKASGDRTTVTAEDRIKQTSIDAGWNMYTKVSDALLADLTSRGLNSYSDKGAEDLNAMRQNLIYALANKYPQWASNFTTTDRDAVPKRIAAFKDLVTDPALANDPNRTDIQYMRAYLAKRDEFTQILGARAAQGGSNSLNAASNQDVSQAWDNFRTAISEKDTNFSVVMNRYLANDSLQQSIIKPAKVK